jgi:cytochrome c-type biogenesis protein CcmH/NrfG
MDTEILQTLHEIRGLLFAITVITCIGVAVWVLHAGTQIAVNLRSAVAANWKRTANMLFEKKKYEALSVYCQARLRQAPNDALALWWLGRACREQGQLELSQQHFRRALEIHPTWKNSIDPYLGDGKSGDASL